MNVRMMPPQGPMGQPQPMGGAPAPMPPQGGPMGGPPMQGQPTAGQQKGQGLGSTFGGSASGRQGFKQFMAAKKQTSAMVPQIPQAQMPMPQAPMGAQPMLPAPNPQMMGAMKPMGAPQMGGPVQAGRPMRGTQGGLGSAPVQLNRGGAVPRQTEIMGEPHMLAYINPEEEALLRGLGGSGLPGPGGVPAYWSLFEPSTWGDGKGFEGFTSSSSSSNTTSMPTNTSVDFTLPGSDDSVATIDYGNDGITNVTYHDDKDDKPATTVVTGSSGYPSLDATANNVVSTGTLVDLSGAASSGYWEPPGFDFDGDDIYGEGSDVLDNNVDNPFVDLPDFSDDNVTPIYDDSDSDYGTGSDETDFSQPVYTPVVDTTPPPPVYTPPPPPPKYYDMFGGEHSSQAAADAADRQYEAQAVAAEAVETVTSTPSDTTYSYTGAGADTDAGGDTDPASMYESSVFREANVPIPESYMPTSEDIMPGITGTGTGTPASERTEAEENAIRALYGLDPIGVDSDEEDDLETAVEDIYNIGLEGEFGGLDLDVPEAEVGLEAALPDYTDDDLGLPDFPVEFPDDGESAEDFRRTEAGLSGIDFDTGQREGGEADENETKDALMNSVKARVSEVEGTSDEGGYDRLLNYQEDNFGITPTEMTVAEILAFQKERGEGSYAEYSRDTVGRIATPVGKYQVVGDTLQRLVDAGVVSADDMFDEATQERIGSYLIENRGLFDENISDEEFVENLGNEFEGIERFGYDDNEVDIFNQPLTGGEDDQQQLPEGSTSASQLYLNAAGRQYQDLTEAEQRALYGARGQTPNAAEAAYLQSLLRSVKHAEDGPIDTREKIPASGITTYGSYIDEDGNFVGSDEITGGTGFDAQGNPIMIDNPNYGKPMYEAGDSVAEQTLGETFEDLLIKALDLFVNPVSILGDKFTLEGQNAAYIQEQLDAYRDGGTFVYGEDGKTVVGVAKPNYDADNDGVNDTVVLNNEDGDFVEDGDDIIVSGDGISISDVEINDNVDGEDEDDDIDIVFSDTTFTNTEDGVVETSVGGTDTTTTGGDNPCPDGYSLVDGMCQPDDGIGTEEGDEAAARVNLRLRKIDRGGGDIPDVTIPDPVEGEALIVRKPAQFNDGGAVEMQDMSVGKNESLGNDMVMLTFADGTKRQTQKALYEAAQDLGALDNMQSGDDFANWHLNEWAGKVVSDPTYKAAHDAFNTNQIAYNQTLMDANPEIAQNRLSFTQQYAPDNQAAIDAAQALVDQYSGVSSDNSGNVVVESDDASIDPIDSAYFDEYPTYDVVDDQFSGDSDLEIDDIDSTLDELNIPVAPMIIRKPAQFFEGGGVYGPDDEDDDYDRYYQRSGNQGYIVTDYGPGYSTYQLGEGENPAGLMNYLDNQDDYQVYKETAPADSSSSFILGGLGGNQTTQGQQGQTSLPVYNPDMPDPTDPTIPDYETPVDPDPIADPIHDPRKMIIRAPKQFKTAYDGIVFNPDSGPRNLDPYTGQRINKPAQFAQGGMVTPNIDRFLQSLGS